MKTTIGAKGITYQKIQKMRKIIFLFILLLVITGCGNENAPDNSEDSDININNLENEVDYIDQQPLDNGLEDIESNLDLI